MGDANIGSNHLKPFQPSVAFHRETRHLIDWFLYEMQHWAKMGYLLTLLCIASKNGLTILGRYALIGLKLAVLKDLVKLNKLQVSDDITDEEDLKLPYTPLYKTVCLEYL